MNCAWDVWRVAGASCWRAEEPEEEINIVARFGEQRRCSGRLLAPVSPGGISCMFLRIPLLITYLTKLWAKCHHPTGSVCSTDKISPMALSSSNNFLKTMLCSLYLSTWPMEKILWGVVVLGKSGSRDLYMATQSSIFVVNGFSHIMCRPRGESPRMTSLCISSSTQMKTASTPSGTLSPRAALALLSVS